MDGSVPAYEYDKMTVMALDSVHSTHRYDVKCGTYSIMMLYEHKMKFV